MIPKHSGFINSILEEGDGEIITVENPSYGTQLATLPGLSIQQIESAINSARLAFDSGEWSERPAQERVAILKHFLKALTKRTDILTALIVAEVGCPCNSASIHTQVSVPLRQAEQIIEFFLTLPEIEENPLPLTERVTPSGQMFQSVRHYSPTGVVAAISAYNYPFLTALWKIIPALVTGNTVVLRPSRLTPLSAMYFANAALEAGLPSGVLNVVLDPSHEGGKLLTTHPDVDMIAFTGSSTVGTQVMAQSAPTMKHLQLELGGKSAQIFMPDFLNAVVPSVVGVCISHAGQGCALGTRIFVPEESKSELLEQMAAALSKIRVGPADDIETQMGPVISAAQRDRCEYYVSAAIEHGGRVVTGGSRPQHLDDGYYFEPTVLELPDNINPAAQDEIFGPVVSVIGYRSVDHAVAMANDSQYGLSGYVFSQDRKQALKVAMCLRTGTVNINGGMMSAYVSSGGHKMSGTGRERGIEGLRLYQQITCLNIGG